MDDVFGADEVLLGRVVDTAGVFSDGEMQRTKSILEDFEKRFPQLFVTVYCGALPHQTSLRQFGFWLLNRAAVCEVEATRPNEHGALFVLDIHGRSAALVVGYFLECYLDQRDLQRILEAGRREFHRGLWAAGIGSAVRELAVRLRRRAAMAAKHPERFAPPRPAAAPALPQFTRIRERNRRSDKSRHSPRPGKS